VNARSRFCCVLGGGGAKTAAHLGAIKALEESGLVPDRYVGTSMGAVVAAAFAAGTTYDAALRRVLALNRRDVARMSWSLLAGPFAKSLLQADGLEETIADLVPARRFADLRVPLTVTAVDIRTGELLLFGDGGDAEAPLIEVLAASCALPVYYEPVAIAGRDLADGGLRSVVPLDVAASFRPQRIIAVHVGPSFQAAPVEPSPAMPAMLTAHSRAVRILMAAQTDAEIARHLEGPTPLLMVEPVAEQSVTFAVGKAIAYVEAGYAAMMGALHDPANASFLDAVPRESTAE
jgi:predicted acylesterase/phospholipase RssA